MGLASLRKSVNLHINTNRSYNLCPCVILPLTSMPKNICTSCPMCKVYPNLDSKLTDFAKKIRYLCLNPNYHPKLTNFWLADMQTSLGSYHQLFNKQLNAINCATDSTVKWSSVALTFKPRPQALRL